MVNKIRRNRGLKSQRWNGGLGELPDKLVGITNIKYNFILSYAVPPLWKYNTYLEASVYMYLLRLYRM